MRLLAAVQEKFRKFKATPAQILVSGFFLFITAGTLLLLLPAASPPGMRINLMDALYTATSAVCVTGLIVKDLSTEFSLFGQIIILCLIQLGGFGYMTSSTLIALFMGKKLGLRDSILIRASMNLLTLEGILSFIRRLVIITLSVETIAAIILSARFSVDLGWKKGIYYGIFHSISAFNNAGFALFPNSLSDYKTDLLVNFTICILIILGGLGFFIFSDLFNYLKKRIFVLTTHTRLVCASSGILVFALAIILFCLEMNNPDITGSYGESLYVSLFQSVSARTAGFNTVDLGAFSNAAICVIAMFMFIGASPGSTGGGIKTTTFAIMLLAVWSSIRGKPEVRVFKRTVPRDMVEKAFLLSSLAAFMVCITTIMLIALENKDFLSTLFEVVSAFGTVGLSLGDGSNHSFSATFSSYGRLLIILTMFIGRVGPITVFTAMVEGKKESRYKLPKGKIIIG